MTPDNVRLLIEKLAAGHHLGPNDLKNLAHSAMCGAIVEHLARLQVPLAAEMRQIENVARHHLEGVTYAAV